MACYEGEILTLVGNFNGWSLSESELCLCKVTAEDDCCGMASSHFVPEGAFLPTIRAPALASHSTRLRFVGKLTHGHFSFQLASASRGLEFRIIPCETYVHQPLRLVCGNPLAIPAVACSGKRDEEDLEFKIFEDPGSIVSIYVELMNGEAVAIGPKIGEFGPGGGRRGVAVWYVLDLIAAHRKIAVPLSNNENKRGMIPESFTSTKGLPLVDVIPDVKILKPEHSRTLSEQAVALSRQIFKNNAMPAIVPAKMQLGLLTTAARDCVLGYCLYSTARDSCMDIEQLAISEEQRGRKLGAFFVQRVVRFAICFGCQMVKLWSTVSARGFYENLGFRARGDVPILEMMQSWGDLVCMEIAAWHFIKDVVLNREKLLPNQKISIEVGTNSGIWHHVVTREGTSAADLARAIYATHLSKELNERRFPNSVRGSHKVIQEISDTAHIYSMDMRLPRGGLVRWTMFAGLQVESDGTVMCFSARLENEAAEAAGSDSSQVQSHPYTCFVFEPVRGRPGMVRETVHIWTKLFQPKDGGSMELVTDSTRNMAVMASMMRIGGKGHLESLKK